MVPIPYTYVKKGIYPVACDFALEALKKINILCPEVKTKCFDMSKGLPFEDGKVDIVVADLSLHYFNWKTTKNIVGNISRVLVPNGILLGRVNSINDFNYGAMTGRKLGKNYFYIDGCKKRFFQREEIINLFKGWNIVNLYETSTDKYNEEKMIWEFEIHKRVLKK
jgi:Methyltransferase domain.